MTNNAQPDGIATALKLIVQNGVDAEAGRNMHLADYNAVAIPNDYSIHKLEGLSLTRDRSRGTYTTALLDDFARFANEHNETTRTFIDARNWSAAAILNWKLDGAQGHCDFMARLVIEPSPEWDALRRLHGMKFTQRGLIDFIEDWTHCIPSFGDLAGNSMTMPQAIAAIRDIKVASQKTNFNNAAEMRTERGMLETIEARDSDKWPAHMGWACTPAFALQPIVADVRLSVLTSHDTPTIAARIVAFDALREHVAHNFSTLLQSKLETQPFAGHFEAGL